MKKQTLFVTILVVALNTPFAFGSNEGDKLKEDALNRAIIHTISHTLGFSHEFRAGESVESIMDRISEAELVDIRKVFLHQYGKTLGLKHNFGAKTGTSSVMDY